MSQWQYWFMFRVADVGDDAARRQSIYDALYEQHPPGGRWYDPTSSGFVGSNLTAEALVSRITRGLNSRVDMLVAGDLSARGDAAYFGSIEHLDILKSFLPDIKKVT